MLKAVIFDMDGTIFDTERVYHDAWTAVGVPEELYWQMIGRGHAEIKKMFRQQLKVSPDILYERCAVEIDRRLAAGIPKKLGLDDLLHFLQEHSYKIALATSSFTKDAKTKLQRAEVEDFFEAVIGGEQVVHGKPAPDIYQKAADAVGCTPEECIVLEDSFNGIRGGHAAGMYTVMIPDLLQPDAEIRTLADAVLPSLVEVPPLLLRLADA